MSISSALYPGLQLPVISILNPLRDIDVILRLEPELFLTVLIERKLFGRPCFDDTNDRMHGFLSQLR